MNYFKFIIGLLFIFETFANSTLNITNSSVPSNLNTTVLNLNTTVLNINTTSNVLKSSISSSASKNIPFFKIR